MDLIRTIGFLPSAIAFRRHTSCGNDGQVFASKWCASPFLALAIAMLLVLADLRPAFADSPQGDIDLQKPAAFMVGDTTTATTIKDIVAQKYVAAAPVTIPDACLRLHLVIALELGEEDQGQVIDDADLAALQALGDGGLGFGCQVSNLSGLEAATGLTTLVLEMNSITDLTPLSGLTKLTVLLLSNNSISDLTPLSGLTSLTELSLNNNSISALTPLSGLTSLTELHLNDNSISALTPLSGLTSLTELSLNNNSISDLTPLSGLTSLTVLHLNNNSISALTPLSGLTSLTELRLSNNSISALAPLSGLTSLVRLVLNNNSITDIAPLRSLTGLEEVLLRSNPLNLASAILHIEALRDFVTRVDSDVTDLSLSFSIFPNPVFADITPSTDVDYYRLSLVEEVFLDIHTEGTLDTVGTLYNDAAVELATDDNAGEGDNFLIQHQFDPGEYFIKVEGNGTDTGNYRIVALDTVFVPPPPPPPLPPEDNTTPPIAVGEIAELQLGLGETVEIDVAAFFHDADGDPLRYSVESQDPRVAMVTSRGSILTVRGVVPGRTRVTVRVTDPTGSQASQVFFVDVAGTRVAFIAEPTSVPEGGTVTFTITLGGTIESAITLNYVIDVDLDSATADADAADHDGEDGALTIMPGETAATFVITIADDADIEPPQEIFTVTLMAPAADTAIVVSDPTATVTISEGVCDRTGQVRDILIRAGRAADCTGVTTADLAALPGLSLMNRQLTALRAGDFLGLTNLNGLFLASNQLTALPAGLFAGLGELALLDLSANRLTSLAADSFAATPKLRRLRLDDNALSALPAGLLAGLEDLEQLRLESNRLEELPAGLFEGASKLTRVQLQDNPGAPFELVMELTRTDAAASAAGPATGVARLAAGAPFAMTAELTAVNGTPSATSVAVPAGRILGEPITVTRLAAGAVRLTLVAAPAVPVTSCFLNDGMQPCFQGITTATRGLILFGNPPVAEQIPDRNLPAGDALRLDLSAYFTASEGTLSYTAVSDNPALATARVEAGMLIVKSNDHLEEGTLTVAVTATDSEGLSTTTTFTVTLTAMARGLLRSWRLPWLAEALSVNGE